VGVAEYHSRPISVAGAVRTPVTFQAVGPTTLLQAIAKAGGLEKTAGPEILVTSGADTFKIPVKGLIEAADPRWNLALKGGEEIRVPESGRIFVVGNVRKPGAFTTPEILDATVMKAIALSEGLMPFSSKYAFIYRPGATCARQEIAVELSRIMERKAPDMPLQPEDILYIPENKGKKLGIAALEKALVFGTTAGATALVWR
jgi:polysaccharide export outer membrane protein